MTVRDRVHGTNSEECAFLLRKWADILDIPSGPFVNEDLRAAADVLERLRAALGEIAREDHDEEAQPGPYSKIATAALEQNVSREVR